MIILFYSLSVLLMIILPIFLGILLRRRFPVPWLLFCVGILTFTVSQVVHLPLNDLLTRAGILPNSREFNSVPLWQSALVLGLTAGLCEELARTVGYAILRRYRKFEDGLMLGLGHGGIESMVIGGVFTAAGVSGLIPLVGKDLATIVQSPDQLAYLTKQIDAFSNTPWMSVMPLVERLLAIGIHVACSMIVLQAFTRRNFFYVVLAILYHAAVDGVLVYVGQSTGNLWLTEGLLVLMVLIPWIWLLRIFPRRQPGQPRLTTTFGSEWSIFITALRKELLQAWRTKRVLVVMAVLGLFGLTSPLLAYFTPQMFKLIPGAEQFAGMIPLPTAKDAIDQYIKNITQFGFILAILLGMGAVVGEKERGTIGMILSKPMTRSAFVTGKLVAQVIVYLDGFLLAMLGGYFYIVILFGNYSFGDFALVTLFLVIWLVPFAAVTLLASVIGGSTGAAAGIAFGGAVILLFAGSIPTWGSLFPSGMIAWASQIGAGAAGDAPNGGALAGCLVLSLVSLVTAIAIFERQEL